MSGGGRDLELARNRKLLTDADLNEALERQTRIRVFEHDLIVAAGGTIVRFDDKTVVIQKDVSDVSYHDRNLSEFFEMPGK